MKCGSKCAADGPQGGCFRPGQGVFPTAESVARLSETAMEEIVMSGPTAETSEILWKREKIGTEEIEVAYREAVRPEPLGTAASRLPKGKLPTYVVDGWGDFPALNPRTYDIGNGVICEQDVAIPMRDGIITYCDIYRPANQT